MLVGGSGRCQPWSGLGCLPKFWWHLTALEIASQPRTFLQASPGEGCAGFHIFPSEPWGTPLSETGYFLAWNPGVLLFHDIKSVFQPIDCLSPVLITVGDPG